MTYYYSPGYYQPTFRSHCYSSASIKIEQAEAMMRGDHFDVLWRKVEQRCRGLIWC